MTDLEMIWITSSMAGRLQKARMDRGWSQQDLASQLDASWAQIKHYESGEVDMPVDRLFDLAECLGVRVADLITDPEE